MSGGSSANNSWTILTPEETVAETLRPLAEGTEHHGESLTSAAGSGANQPAEGEASAGGSPVEKHLVSEEKTAELSGDTSTEQHTSAPTAVTDAPVPTSLEVSSSFVPGSDAPSQSEGLPEGLAKSSPDPDSFSDSYSHITSSPDEPPSSLLSTETLGGMEFTQEEERLEREGALHPLNGEELQQEGQESDLFPRTTDLGNQADSPVDSEVGEERTERTEGEGEPEVRRRRSLLAALERIGRAEEEEEGEEEFQLPQREEDSGFSVNKCILGAVILLGLGTIFFSGVFMDLDEESDYGTRELKESDVPGKQEWLNPEVPPSPLDADNTELLNKLDKGNQQISVLQAQLQAQREELNVAMGQAAEGAKERLRWEEVEKENSRLKTEMASLPVLQTENERMKRELESVPALQKELETLRSTVTELKRSSAASEAAQEPVKPTPSPPSGQPEDSRQDTAAAVEKQARKPWSDQKEKKTDWKKEKYDIGEKKGLKEREKTERKEGEKKERKDGGKTEWNKGKHEQGKFDKEKDKEGKQKRHSDETKERKEKELKKDKGSRGDEGKPWKAREGKREWIEKSERKDWKEEKEVKEGKQWRGKEEKTDWRGGKDHGEKHKGKDEWKGEKEWKKVKDGFKGGGNEKWEKKDWKEKGERKEWKKGGEGWGKNGKDEGNERKGKGERKQWDESENRSKNLGKERKGKDERKQWNENEWKSKNGKDDKEWKRKDERKQWNENEWKSKNGKDDKEWKRKDERKQWNENEWKSKNGKDDKERKRKDERKQWNENEWKSKNGKDDKERKRKDETKQREKKDEEWKRDEKRQKEKKQDGDWKKERSSAEKNKDELKFSGNHHHDHHEKHEWGDRKAPHTHRRPSLEQPEYWVQQRDRLQHNPKPPQHCNSLETCAQGEGLLPVPFPEFDAILKTYLAKAEKVGVDAFKREELKKLAAEFFKDGVFVHDQISFQDFVEDVGDILEDMVEGDENGEEEEEEEDSAIEQEMEEFEREVMKKFAVPGVGEKEERVKGEWRKESGQARG